MDSANHSTIQGELSSETADVDSSTSQDGSDDGGRGSSPSDESLARCDACKTELSTSDDMAHSKDSTKKKRSNKTAKLKQSKQDIRREQFLAQVGAKTGRAAASTATSTLKAGGVLKPRDNAIPDDVSSVGTTDSVNSASTDGGDDVASKGHAKGIGPGSVRGEVLQGGNSRPEGRIVTPEPDVPAGMSRDEPGDLGYSPSNLPLAMEGSAECNEEKPVGPSEAVSCGYSSKKKETENALAGKATKKYLRASGSTGDIPSSATLEETSGIWLHGLQSDKNAGKGVPVLNGRNFESSHKVPGSVEDEEGGHGDSPEGEGLEDDWEAAAEEFSRQVAKVGSAKLSGVSEAKPEDPATCRNPSQATGGAGGKPAIPGAQYSFRPNQQDPNLGPRLCAPNGLRPEYTFSASSFSRSRSANDRAWRPDDVSRPPTLPPAMSSRVGTRGLLGAPGDVNTWRTPPQLSQSHWPAPSGSAQQPTCCPICAEELDVTDSSFVPCSCGFRLCLFCHHRIAADDGRCPGCRRAYSPDVTSRLSKPPSSWLRL